MDVCLINSNYKTQKIFDRTYRNNVSNNVCNNIKFNNSDSVNFTACHSIRALNADVLLSRVRGLELSPNPAENKELARLIINELGDSIIDINWQSPNSQTSVLHAICELHFNDLLSLILKKFGKYVDLELENCAGKKAVDLADDEGKKLIDIFLETKRKKVPKIEPVKAPMEIANKIEKIEPDKGPSYDRAHDPRNYKPRSLADKIWGRWTGFFC